MKHGSTLFLKTIIVLSAVFAITSMIYFPPTEGRAANLDLVSIYTDPFIIYLYIASIPFFIALYQAFKLLGYVEKSKLFSLASVKAVRNIKYCVVAFMGFIIGALIFISIMARMTGDDSAGAVALGLVTIFASGVIATIAAVFQKLLQNAVDIKSENDLIV